MTLGAERPIVARPGQNIDHRRAFVEGRFELGRVVHFDDLYAHHADGVIIDIARVFRNDDFVLEAR